MKVNDPVDGILGKTIWKHRLKTTIAFHILAIALLFGLLSLLVLRAASFLGFGLERFKSPWIAALFMSIFCMVVVSVINYFLMHMIFVPLEKMSEAAKQVGKGDFTVQLEYKGSIEELGSTIENFNRMVRELNSVETMRQDFIASVSHEFKTPLSAVNGYVMLLQEPKLSEEEKQEYLHKIRMNMDKLNDLSENILRLTRLESEQYLYAETAYRLDEQIREAIVLLEPKWEEKKLELELELPDCIYTGQKELLYLVWTNLIGNAIKYTDEGGLLSVKLEKAAHQLQISVRDTGMGMSPETMAHMYEKFYQGDTSRKSQGNGLGLCLCREIMKRIGGTIEAESELGKGTVFFVRLPVD